MLKDCEINVDHNAWTIWPMYYTELFLLMDECTSGHQQVICDTATNCHIFNFMIVPLIFHFLAKVLNFNNKYSKP